MLQLDRIGTTTFHRIVKQKKYFRPASFAVKPALTDPHTEIRIAFVRRNIHTEDLYYNPQYQTIHIDEKWLNQLPTTERCYLANNKFDPVRE
jgi:hypothetical protein